MTTVLNEIDLHHLTAEEAAYRLDKYLNDAFIAGKMRVKIIHGKGTGTLRQVVSEELAGHPLVRSYRLAGYGEGDDGVTIAELVMR
ncbi:MAG: Smr/MutS family protein [Dehalococcoidales bacterium]|nr:Smr/MutS family protein [Dehalococcoidales bacterium]